jgi:hypothetical protein
MVKYKKNKMEKNMKQIMDDMKIIYNHLMIFFRFLMMIKKIYMEKQNQLKLNLNLF